MNNEIKNQMETAMADELEQVLATLERANSTFERLFGKQEGENE